MEYTGLYYSEDIQFRETSSFNQSVFESGKIFYEVIRIIDGTALFLEDHLQRLQDSVRLGGYSFQLSLPFIHYLLRNLIRRNNTANGNVKIIVHFRDTEESPVIFSFFIPHFYPDAEMYMNGVNAALYKAERTDPNIKMVRHGIMDDITAFIKSNGIYDVLLVDQDENITEGSRTNVFFVRNNIILTPPSAKVLKGVTRAKVFKLSAALNIRISEQNITCQDLNEFDGAFFTGTSPKILPIKSMDAYEYSPGNMLIQKLMTAYDQLIADYLENN